jgi:hypothetical protein
MEFMKMAKSSGLMRLKAHRIVTEKPIPVMIEMEMPYQSINQTDCCGFTGIKGTVYWFNSQKNCDVNRRFLEDKGISSSYSYIDVMA